MELGIKICYCGHKEESHKKVTKRKVCLSLTCECLNFKKADYPPFVLMNNVALRLADRERSSRGLVYYRDAGAWSVRFKRVGLKIFATVPNERDSLHHAHGLELVPCSRKVWKRDNLGYV